MKNITLIFLIAIGTLASKAQTTIAIKDIDKHIGETVTICDSVYTTRALAGVTLFNMGAVIFSVAGYSPFRTIKGSSRVVGCKTIFGLAFNHS